MIKFIHKRHMHATKTDSRIIIYYNASDIFLGVTLLILVIFFINNYLSHALIKPFDNTSLYMGQDDYVNKQTETNELKP